MLTLRSRTAVLLFAGTCTALTVATASVADASPRPHRWQVARSAASGDASALSAASSFRRRLPSPSPSPSPSATPTVTTSPTPTPTPTGPATSTPSTTPTPLPSVNPLLNSPSGVTVPVGDLPGWHQVYAEDFGTAAPLGGFPGPAYQEHWSTYLDGWKDTSRNGTYMPSKVLSVHDGVLDYDIHTENGVHLVSAPVLKQTWGQTYGRYSVRFTADQLPGYKTAWLLWPDSGTWPNDGEIDFPEGDLGAGGTIGAFSHYASATGGQDAFGSNASSAQWHTATIEWAPGKVTFLLDDSVLGVSTHAVPATAMHWVLQTETALSGGAPADSVRGHVLVDWVALYTRA